MIGILDDFLAIALSRPAALSLQYCARMTSGQPAEWVTYFFDLFFICNDGW